MWNNGFLNNVGFITWMVRQFLKSYLSKTGFLQDSRQTVWLHIYSSFNIVVIRSLTTLLGYCFYSVNFYFVSFDRVAFYLNSERILAAFAFAIPSKKILITRSYPLIKKDCLDRHVEFEFRVSYRDLPWLCNKSNKDFNIIFIRWFYSICLNLTSQNSDIR